MAASSWADFLSSSDKATDTGGGTFAERPFDTVDI